GSRTGVGAGATGGKNVRGSCTGRATTVRGGTGAAGAGAGAVATPRRKRRASRATEMMNAPRISVFVTFQAIASVATPLVMSRYTATTEVSDKNRKNSICGTTKLYGELPRAVPVACHPTSRPVKTLKSAF